MTLGSIVQDETALRLEHALNLGGDLQEEAFEPVSFVPFAVSIFRLPVVWGRGNDKINALVRHPPKSRKAIAYDHRPKAGDKVIGPSQGLRDGRGTLEL
jgi:hypothetical protein